jgi:hypothetical protein
LILAAESARLPTPFIIWMLVGAIALSYAVFVFATPATQDAIDLAFGLIPARFDPASAERFANWYEAAGPYAGSLVPAFSLVARRA